MKVQFLISYGWHLYFTMIAMWLSKNSAKNKLCPFPPKLTSTVIFWKTTLSDEWSPI